MRRRRKSCEFQPVVEGLPKMQLLSGGLTATLSSGVLKISGTDADDDIRVYQSKSVVKVEGVRGSFALKKIRMIQVDAKGGDDTIDLAITPLKNTSPKGLSAQVDGGLGNDVVSGNPGLRISRRDVDTPTLQVSNPPEATPTPISIPTPTPISTPTPTPTPTPTSDQNPPPVGPTSPGPDQPLPVVANAPTPKISWNGAVGTLDYSAWKTPVTVDLKAGTATGVSSTAGISRVIGGQAADEISGSDAADVLIGGGGNDVINGRGGDDMIVGGEGDDSLSGGAGDDTLVTASGRDSLFGGDGNDTFAMGIDSASVWIDGNTGFDTLDYSAWTTGVSVDLTLGIATGTTHISAVTRVIGGSAADHLIGSDGDDVLFGNGGDDVLDGRAGNDVIKGAAGNDTIVGGSGSDALDGGDDDDSIVAGDGDDILLGGGGSDTLDGGAGVDAIRGDDGADLLSGGDGDDIADGGAGDDTLSGGPGGDALYGGNGNDLIQGDDGNDLLSGDAGNDTLGGGAGDDVVGGGDGDDRVYGDTIDDHLAKTGGNDQLFGDAIRGGTGVDELNGGYGNDFLSEVGPDEPRAPFSNYTNSLYGDYGDDILVGGDTADFLFGDQGNDILIGGGNNDVLNGYDGNDQLDAGSGNDTLYGGGGNDKLYGGPGRDDLNGGPGNDDMDKGPTGEGDTWFGGDGVDSDDIAALNVLIGLESLLLAISTPIVNAPVYVPTFSYTPSTSQLVVGGSGTPYGYNADGVWDSYLGKTPYVPYVDSTGNVPKFVWNKLNNLIQGIQDSSPINFEQVVPELGLTWAEISRLPNINRPGV
jgi:Ca2+-binding RTX toxin-like protein